MALFLLKSILLSLDCGGWWCSECVSVPLLIPCLHLNLLFSFLLLPSRTAWLLLEAAWLDLLSSVGELSLPAQGVIDHMCCSRTS